MPANPQDAGGRTDALVRCASAHFRAERWAVAARLLEAAVRAGADGEDVRRLLGTARFLAGDRDGALDAWNPIGAPLPDGPPEVHGARRTPADLYERVAALPEREPLSRTARVGAERRLTHLPGLRSARVRWEPVSLDRARVRLVVSEEPRRPSGWLEVGARVLEAAVRDEAVWTVGSPLGRGGAVRALGRWREGRRAGALVAGMPVGARRRTVLHAGGGWREETAALGNAPAAASEPAARAAGAFLLVGAGGWVGPRHRWRADLRAEDWSGAGSSDGGAGPGVGAAVELEHRSLDDRLSLLGRAGLHLSGSGGGWETAEARLRLRSRAREEGWVVAADAAWAAVSREAPHPLWPGAGTGTARDPLLRAHPLLDGGTIRGVAFGRTLVRTGLEARWWALGIGPVRVAPAAFVDAAAVWRSEGRPEGPWWVDAGVGLRVSAAGGPGGTLRVDAATGVTDRAGAVSVGWSAPWPGEDPLTLRRR